MERSDNLFHALLSRKQEELDQNAQSTDQSSAANPPEEVPKSKPQNPKPNNPQKPKPAPRPDMSYPGGILPIPVAYVKDAKPRKKITRSDKVRDPSKCGTFEEQVEVIADNIRNFIVTGRVDQAVKTISDWYDGVIDSNGNLYDHTREVLNGISKANLLKLIEALIRYAG